MEPVSIAIICAVAFGGVVALSVFVRQLLLSRDKKLNDEAQSRALNQEAKELEKLRSEIESSSRLNSHYNVLGANKEAIIYIDNKIEELLMKKAKLIERYGLATVKETDSIIQGDVSQQRKEVCDHLRMEIDEELKMYDEELKSLQQRRASLWDSRDDFQKYILDQEKKKNESLDSLYSKHTELLQKIYLRHADNTENVARDTIKAGNYSFKMMVSAPFKFMMQFFGLSTNIDKEQSSRETEKRRQVQQMEAELNGQDEYEQEHQNSDAYQHDFSFNSGRRWALSEV